jgi:uncharacterized protein YndB with AHSA1/START domain
MAQPVDIDLTREMTSSADAVWTVLSDLKRLPEWLAFAGSLEDVSSDAAVEGATYTVKPSRAFEPKTKWRIASVDERRRQVHTSEMPMLSGVTSTIELSAPDSGGPASVRVHWHGEPSNFFGRMMRGMFQRQIEENWRKSLEELDRVASGA